LEALPASQPQPASLHAALQGCARAGCSSRLLSPAAPHRMRCSLRIGCTAQVHGSMLPRGAEWVSASVPLVLVTPLMRGGGTRARGSARCVCDALLLECPTGLVAVCFIMCSVSVAACTCAVQRREYPHVCCSPGVACVGADHDTHLVAARRALTVSCCEGVIWACAFVPVRARGRPVCPSPSPRFLVRSSTPTQPCMPTYLHPWVLALCAWGSGGVRAAV
jgi:hypothetical protein